MIKRLYIHNFRCFENFELALEERPSVLLLGRSGAGKTTVRLALEVLQAIARGQNRVGKLVTSKDITQGRTEVPMRFEIEANLAGSHFAYTVAFEYPPKFRELRVLDEALTVDGTAIFSRNLAQVQLPRNALGGEAAFRIDWHLVALPIVQEQNDDEPLAVFKRWLANSLILGPVPSHMRGESELNASGLTMPNTQVTNIVSWFSSMVSAEPATYLQVSEYLKLMMPDFERITNPSFGKETRGMIFHFMRDKQGLDVDLEDLADGEKCFVIFALTIAMDTVFGPLFCFWDAPDNFLTSDEVGHSIMSLRKCFQDKGQLVVTSHNPEVIRRFSESDTLYLSRRSHLEPTTVAPIETLRANGKFAGSFIDAILRGDLDP
jgi:predicted ATPase